MPTMTSAAASSSSRLVSSLVQRSSRPLRLHNQNSVTLAATSMSSEKRNASSRREGVQEPRPSSSVLLLSPSNDVLLLHRVQTSSSFASAHVFPGGNLDGFHDGEIPGPSSPERHRDGPAYRAGAIRETFEETGILLATRDGALVEVPADEREAARKKIHSNKVKFGDYLDSIGAVADTDGLIPFTRWITPPLNPKRFTTQMYLYLLPMSQTGLAAQTQVPTHDGGIEHTAAHFAPVQTFLEHAARRSIILFPPQVYLMTLLAEHLTGHAPRADRQREELLDFLGRGVTADTEDGKQQVTAGIPWADKVICPYSLLVREQDGRTVLGLDKPGPELEGSGRGGDGERVVLVKFGKAGPSGVEVRMKARVLEEQRRIKAGTRL